MLRCVACRGKQVTKNGHIHVLDKTAHRKGAKFQPTGPVRNGKQRYLCKSCGRQFVYGATNKRIGNETKTQIDKLLLEKLSLAGIARVQGVSETWLQNYVNQKYAGVEKQVAVAAKKGA